jgi:hypothetical protein
MCHNDAAAADDDLHSEIKAKPKVTETKRHRDPCYTFVPLSIKTHSCLGRPFITPINQLGDVAAASGGFTRAQFCWGILRKLSVCLFSGSYLLDRTMVGFLTWAPGTRLILGLPRTSAVATRWSRLLAVLSGLTRVANVAGQNACFVVRS